MIFTLKFWWICINASNDDDLSLFIVNCTYVFNRHTTLNDLSALVLVTRIVNTNVLKIVSLYSTGLVTSNVSHIQVGVWSQGVIHQRVLNDALSDLSIDVNRSFFYDAWNQSKTTIKRRMCLKDIESWPN